MANENNNKDVANSLSRYSDFANKGINAGLDTANQINKWYQNELDKMTEVEDESTRLGTKVDNSIVEQSNQQIENTELQNKIETKADNSFAINKANRISTKVGEIILNDEMENTGEITTDGTEKAEVLSTKTSKTPKKIATLIKGTKVINNTTNKIVKVGKSISTGMNQDSSQGFERSANRIMTKPIKKAANKITNKITKKATNILIKNGERITKTTGKQVVKGTIKLLLKLVQLITKLITSVVKSFIAMLPEIAPIIIIIVIIVSFCSFFGMNMSDEHRDNYEKYMIETQNEYDSQTVKFYNEGKVVEGAIDGKGMINWKAPLSIIQMLNGNMEYDSHEKELLKKFKDAGLFETIKEETYTYEKETEETDEDGNTTTKKETITETKEIVTNPSLEDYIKWCNNNFSVINNYKKNKKIEYNSSQTSFTESEVEQIKLLYNSTSFFDLFSDRFKQTYAYSYVEIGDEQLQAIYNEFLANAGKRYLMDHSNLKYDECMDYYDCSSWTIHCLAHTGIKTIANTGATGLYKNYCNPVAVSDRKGGDLIFLKNTYGNFPPGEITHVGIYMGELTINGETAEWVIDTGGNPTGVKIRKYNNGWWNGSHFAAFGRLK